VESSHSRQIFMQQSKQSQLL